MVAATPLLQNLPTPRACEDRILISGVPWETYVALREADQSASIRMTYCEGALEIMSPSSDHEIDKTLIARLLEMWAIERDVPLQGSGSTTFRKQAKARGLEPDESYCVGHPLVDVPDIAFEVVVTSGGIDKLTVYEGLGVREVWFWEDDAFHLHALRPGGYEEIAKSELLPTLDLDVLATFVRRPDQHEAVKAYVASLRAGG